jgi:hypothetical protein
MGNDETSRVKQIRVTSPWFKVSNKIYAGVPFKIAESVYKLKKIATFEDKGGKRSIYDDVKGIGFEVDDKGYNYRDCYTRNRQGSNKVLTSPFSLT